MILWLDRGGEIQEQVGLKSRIDMGWLSYTSVYI
jgi:hypothetical protein